MVNITVQVMGGKRKLCLEVADNITVKLTAVLKAGAPPVAMPLGMFLCALEIRVR